jgi:hypothetical protein
MCRGACRRTGSPKQDAEGWKSIPLTSRKFFAKKADWKEQTGCLRLEDNSPARLWRDTSTEILHI